MIPTPTTRQFSERRRSTSPVDSTGREDRKASVSCSERRSQNTTGMIRQPISSGTRQPQDAICSGSSTEVKATPNAADSITATCWLPDCQAQ